MTIMSNALCVNSGGEDRHTFKIWAVLLHMSGSTGKGGTWKQEVNSHVASRLTCRGRQSRSRLSLSVSGGASAAGEGVRWGSGRGAPPLCPQRTGQLSRQ